MRYVTQACTALVLAGLTSPAFAQEKYASPAQIYGDLFVQVQMERVFPDSKAFVDMSPTQPPQQVLDAYRRAKAQPGFDLREFVAVHFVAAPDNAREYHSDTTQNVQQHIDALWPVLTRGPDPSARYSSLLPLPNPYIVPGGRFKEVYYWDSYFTLLGLEESGRHDMVVAMVNDFADLLDRLGHIPNGTRTYYLSRSQPPFFAAMVDLVAARDGAATYAKYLPQLRKEYEFWMEGATALGKGEAHRRVVKLEDATLLNRYWDDSATPREESYREDVETARAAGRPAEDMYRNLRAAAESGWDFSSRWFADGRQRKTIRTVQMLPVDLNSLLYHLELTLAKAYAQAGEQSSAAQMKQHAAARAAAVRKLMWDERQGVYVDYLWAEKRAHTAITAAALYPLFFGIADRDQARKTAVQVRKSLLGKHGLLTTTIATGEQWDAPNGWAPLQWIAIKGLRGLGQEALAGILANRWIAKNTSVYRESGKLVEKYNVAADVTAGGGEYPLQDGFGWTNGVLRKLLVMYPQREVKPEGKKLPEPVTQ